MSKQCDGCTLCCQWGDEHLGVQLLPLEKSKYESVSGSFVLQSKDNGDCVYLDRKTGCTIYKRRPFNCREFNCTVLLDEILKGESNHFLRVLMKAVRIKISKEH